MGYLVTSRFRSLDNFALNHTVIDTYEYSLKNSILTAMIDYTGHFVQLMSDLFENQITIGNSIAFAFISSLMGLGAIQVIFSVLLTRAIYNQAKLLLNIPVTTCIKQQKKVAGFWDHIRNSGAAAAEFENSISTEDSEYRCSESLLLQQLQENFNVKNVDADPDTTTMKRRLSRSLWQKLEWAWRLGLCVGLGVSMMLIYYLGGNAHFSLVREVADIFNSTGRIAQVLHASENFQR